MDLRLFIRETLGKYHQPLESKKVDICCKEQGKNCMGTEDKDVLSF